jgi:hypothetical protein
MLALPIHALLLVVLSVSAFSADSCLNGDRTVEIILDASGSMNARLPEGPTRIDAARASLEGVVQALPPEVTVGLRLYGSQSPKSEKNCRDSLLAVPFGSAATAGPETIAAARSAKAQGYTPIAFVLGLALQDFPAPEGDRVVVLVSDGKETCEGDPCAAAKPLADAGITVHSVGFVVDSAAREQLKCIARATGGQYFDAPTGPELGEAVKSAASACKTAIKVEKKKPGYLQVAHPDLAGHEVINSTTGETVGTIDVGMPKLELPAGIYTVRFGPAQWKGIEVEGGETTLIEPGNLLVENASLNGHEVRDSETGELHATVGAGKTNVTLMPGVYDVQFGSIVWPFVKIDGGAEVTLRPGFIQGQNVGLAGSYVVRTADGTEAGAINSMNRALALPPGEYVIDIDGTAQPLSLAEGQQVDIDFGN